MSTFGKAVMVRVLIAALSTGPVAVAEAQPPIRIGASLALTGQYAVFGQNQHRGFQLCFNKEFPGADLIYHAASGYGGCQVLVEAIRRAGSLDGEKIREAILKILEAILKMDLNTAFGAFKVDANGFQIAHRMVMFQWQDVKKVIVWPEELAQGKPRFPTPAWSQRP